MNPINKVLMFSLIAPCCNSDANTSAFSLVSSSQETIILEGYRLSYKALDSRKNSGLKIIFLVLYLALTEAV